MTPAKHRAAARLVIGFEGADAAAEDDFVARLREIGAGGVILFARNIRNADQTRELIARIRRRVDWPLLFAVDQEGGPVIRLTRGATVFPGNMALGSAGRPELAREQGRISGAQLARIGFDLNLAPVVDLQTNPANPGIGIRSFGAERGAAGALAREYVLGHAESGVSTCLKHFPGKGAAGVDAHIDLPVLDHALDEFRDPHLEIFSDLFRELRGNAVAVMSTHILVRGLDPELPATLSPRVMKEILREDLGFRGPVITDCLEMGAIVKRWGVADAALASAQAGHDIILVCHTPQRQRAAAARLEEALAAGELSVEENVRALDRMASLRNTRPPRALNAATDLEAGARLARTISREAMTLFSDDKALLPLDPEEGLEIVAPRPRSVVGAEEETNRDWPGLLRAAAGEAGFQAARVHSLEPDDEGAARELAARVCGTQGKILLLGWDARGEAASAALLAQLAAAAADRLVVAHLRNPFDQALVPAGVTAVTTHGYTRLQIEELFRALASEEAWPGTMPA
jgi:beta-N-acetylhexosaminidase